MKDFVLAALGFVIASALVIFALVLQALPLAIAIALAIFAVRACS